MTEQVQFDPAIAEPGTRCIVCGFMVRDDAAVMARVNQTSGNGTRQPLHYAGLTACATCIEASETMQDYFMARHEMGLDAASVVFDYPESCGTFVRSLRGRLALPSVEECNASLEFLFEMQRRDEDTSWKMDSGQYDTPDE